MGVLTICTRIILYFTPTDGEYPLKRRRVEPVQENEVEETQLPIDPENAFFDFQIERQEENIPEFEGNGSMGAYHLSDEVFNCI